MGRLPGTRCNGGSLIDQLERRSSG